MIKKYTMHFIWHEQPKILLLFIDGAVSASQRNTYVERRSDVETAPSINNYNILGW